jgi:hypothetical protein
MRLNVTEAAQEWAAEHPRVVETTTALEEAGIPTALFSSAAHEIVRRSLDLPPLRQPGDVDLLVVHGYIKAAASALGEKPNLHMLQARSSDGYTLSCIGYEVLTQLGSDIVQLVDPSTRLRAGTHSYNTRYTEHAAAARTVIETDQGLLPLAHMADTVIIYSILQRNGDGKADLHNTAQLLRADDPMAAPYGAERAAIVGLDARAWGFILQAGEVAAHNLKHAA